MQRVLVLRIIPYSDRSRIVHCLTASDGLCSYFLNTSKRNPKGVIQVGAFVKLTCSRGRGSQAQIKEVALDDITAAHRLGPAQLGLWLFVIELVSKSAQEAFHIPMLLPALSTYYCFLAEEQVSDSPATPLILLAHIYGILDASTLGREISPEVILDLKKLGISSTQSPSLEYRFEDYLKAFQRHFSIKEVASLSLIE